MIAFLSSLWGKFAGFALAIVGILAALAKIKRDGVKQGRLEERAKALEAQNQAIRERGEIDAEISAMSDDDVRKRLHEHWARYQ